MAKAHQTGSIGEDIARAAAFLRSRKDIIVTAAACRQDYEDFVAYGRHQGLSSDELAELTKRTLSEAVPQLLQEADAAGLFLTGGDTAIAVIQALQCADSAGNPAGICAGTPLRRHIRRYARRHESRGVRQQGGHMDLHAALADVVAERNSCTERAVK